MLITNHQVFFTPLQYPKAGGVYYISKAASNICIYGLAKDKYRLHKYRTVFMNSLGALGLIIGDVYKVEGLWRFIEPCEKLWSKPGALKLDTKYKINIEVMVEGDFTGSTRVCLNDESIRELMYSCSSTGDLR